MSNKLYVGGISWDTNDAGLSEFFSTIGGVISASIVTDKFSGKSRGFGFVEMESDELAQKAIQELNGKTLDGRELTVNEAKPQEPRDNSRNRSDNNRGGGGGGYNRNDRNRRY